METIYTYWFIGSLIAFITFIYLLMVIKRRTIQEMEDHFEDLYPEEINNQIIESGQNTFM